ncbi:MAG: hypothetical protein IKJ43_04595 [Bacilli bacterium]|nr:hypothetical protein [Bacilli bacterium]
MNQCRKEIDFSSLPLIIQDMIEENVPSAAIIDEMLETKGEMSTIGALIILDDMNIRGVQISTLYKICHQNIDEFYEKIITITPEDIDKLNYETFAICKYKAIFDGNKEERKQNPDKYIFTDEERTDLRNKKSKDHVQEILNDNQSLKKTNDDLYPSISSKEAIEIINKNGFTCGYKKNYEDINGRNIIYRVFYNDLGDILYTHSLEEPDIFLYGQSKLNAVRINTVSDYEDLGCNAYVNVDGVVGYNIELREKPFEKYQKILDRKEPTIKTIKHNYYDSNLYPIIESIEGINYKTENEGYDSLVISEIYSLLTFPETYYDLDDRLKQIYSTLLSFAEEKAYDEIIYQLNSDEAIDTIINLQKVLGISLDKEKLIEAKNRFLRISKSHFNIPRPRFLSDFIVKDPQGKNLEERIEKVMKQTVEN